MKNSPLVSVIMPMYNSEKYLRETIESVLSQTYSNWELIAVNDASSDGSKDIILSYTDKRIRYFENEKNLGIAGARNRAVELAQGEYCAILDHDDIALPQRFEKQVRFLSSHPTYGLCGSWAKSVDGATKYTFPTQDTMIKCSLLFHFPFVHSSVMARTELMRQFKYRQLFNTAEDYDVISRMSEVTKMANLRAVLALFRVHANNASRVSYNAEARKEIRVSQAKHLNIIPTAEELEIQCGFVHLKTYHDNLPADYFQQLRIFLKKIINANSATQYYNSSSLKAYLWFRWILACFFLNRKNMLLKSGLATLNPIIVGKLVYLLWEKR